MCGSDLSSQSHKGQKSHLGGGATAQWESLCFARSGFQVQFSASPQRTKKNSWNPISVDDGPRAWLTIKQIPMFLCQGAEGSVKEQKGPFLWLAPLRTTSYRVTYNRFTPGKRLEHAIHCQESEKNCQRCTSRIPNRAHFVMNFHCCKAYGESNLGWKTKDTSIRTWPD